MSLITSLELAMSHLCRTPSPNRRSFSLLVGLVALVMWWAPMSGQTPATTGATIYEGATLIDGTGAAVVENAAFVVADGRIAAVGRSGQVTAPSGAARVSLTGKTVIPALIDAHTHPAITRDTLVDQLRAKAYFGAGAILSMGLDSGTVAFEVRNETIPGAARLRTAGRGITSPEPGRTDVPYWVTTEAEARKAVQELAARKVDIVKIWVDDRDGKYKKLSPDLYGAVIDEAHRQKLRVAAHIFALDDAKGLLKAGIDVFAHGVRDRDVDDEFVAMMKARPQVLLIPNLPDRGVPAELGWLSGSVPTAELQKMQASAAPRPEAQTAFGIQARNLAKLNAAGVKIAMGTDGFSAWSQHVEMEDMVAAGMTPMQVLVAATRVSAEVLQLRDVGTIQTGQRADFVVLDASPLSDITNTRKISAVYLAGAPVDREALRTRWTTQAPR